MPLLNRDLLSIYLMVSGTIVDMSMEERDELYGLIYPFISMSSRVRCFLKRSCLCHLTFHIELCLPELPITIR